MKEKWHNLRLWIIHTLAHHAPRRKMNWLYYTIIFGSLPIAIRIVVAFATSSGQVDLFAPADFAFYGIMLNTAAIANVTAGKKYSPDLIAGVMAVAITHIVLMVAIYCVALFPEISKAATLAIGFIVLVSSFLFSLITTSKNLMSDIDAGLDVANKRDDVDPLILALNDMLATQTKEGNAEMGDGFRKALSDFGYELDEGSGYFVKKTPRS